MALGRPASQALSDVLAEQPAEAPLRLLVVDDSVTTRTLVKAMLDAEGYSVTVAADGMEAWKFLQEGEADLVVSDVEMPRMDGFALTEAIRASARLRDLPVILMTALETDKDRLHGMEVGATAYLPKSAFDQTNLLQAIRQIL
jgi:two-component system chemotaxis sensor kinase CheA